MAGEAPIRTPWMHKWRRFRYSALPALCFMVSVVLVFWLWERQGELPNAVGALEWADLLVTAGVDGKLVEVRPGGWQPCDPVRKGELIARLDDSLLAKARESLEKERERLADELLAERARIELDNADRRHDYQREARRLAWQAEQQRLEVLDRQVEIEADRILLRGHVDWLKYHRPLVGKGIVTQREVDDILVQHNVVKKQIDENLKGLATATQQLKLAGQRLDEYPPLVVADADSLLAPIRSSINVQRALIEELKPQMAALEVRSPVDGTIVDVYYKPGQYVQAGEPIFTIAPAGSGYIISYVRPSQRFQPQPGMTVDVRVRAPGSRPVAATVHRVGSQFELIPIRLLRNSQLPEWGLPVRIRLPDGMPVSPGELIDVTFKPPMNKGAG